MARTFIRQDAQIGSTLDTIVGFDDAIAPAATMESGAAEIAGDLNNIRSMLSYFNDLQAGNWYDALTAPVTLDSGSIRGIQSIGDDLHELERKRVLVKAISLADVSVAASSAATGTLTSAGVFSDTETVTIGSRTYTFRTPFVNAADNIDASGTVAQTHENLRRAINGDGVAGTNYGTGTVPHADVTATDGATTNVITAKGGTFGNTIATTETGANISFGAATLTGGAGGDVVILGTGELPSNLIAAVGAVTTRGTVVAPDTGTFGEASLAEVAGSNAIAPKNFVEVVDGSTRDPILSDGRRIYGLLQGESGLADGDTILIGTPDRVQVTFVRINAAGDDLETIEGADLGSQSVNLCFTERKALDDLTEQDFLRGAVTDVPSSSVVTRQAGYDNQGTIPVDLTTNATLDLEGAGLVWSIRDDLEALLFRILEGSAGGTSEVQLGSAVDVFNVDAIVNNFDAGISARTGGTRPIDVGVTDGVIESTAGDLELQAAAELFLDDGNRGASTFSVPWKITEDAAEWSALDTTFGEVSLAAMLVAAYNSSSRTRVDSIVSPANIAANADVNGPGTPHANVTVDLLPFNIAGIGALEVFLNGELLKTADDYIAGGTPVDGDLQFTFILKGTGTKPDQITVIRNGAN